MTDVIEPLDEDSDIDIEPVFEAEDGADPDSIVLCDKAEVAAPPEEEPLVYYRSSNGKLSMRQKIFCEKYLETYSVKEAAEFAKVHMLVAYRWLNTHEAVKKYVDTRFREIASALGVKQEWILSNWVELLNRGMGRIKGYKSNPRLALKASELIAKHLGMFEQTLNINHNIIPQMVIERYQDADYREVESLASGDIDIKALFDGREKSKADSVQAASEADVGGAEPSD